MKEKTAVEILEIQTQQAPIYPVLIHDGDDLILIDACFPFQFQALAEAIEKNGGAVDNITHIILTHQDIDHIGCVNEILERCPHVKIIAHTQEAPYMDGRLLPVKLQALEENKENLPPDMFSFYQQMKKGFAARRFSVDNAVRHQDILPFCGAIEVLHTPGHTPGHICLYIPQEKMLIAGDALQVEDGILKGPAPQYTQNMAQALTSLKQLCTKEINSIVAYHGGVFQGDVQKALQFILHSV